ncbi:MAG: amidohydrolase family protein, partial [Phycisphaerae bacterium]|nr:amidohydrolase family protein [Phycisphaerae bacterium]
MLHPDYILHHANIITLNPWHPHASAVAIAGARLAFVGDDRTTLALAGARTRILDVGGRTIVPGFCDAHIHLLSFGTSLLWQADLTGTRTIDEILQRLSDLAARTQGWIRGRGFDQSKLLEGRFPTRNELDRVSRDRPIVISRVCGHAGVLNSAAIDLLDEPHRRSGDPQSGLFTEEALWGVYSLIPPLTEPEMEQAALAACDVLLKTGITSVQTLLDTPEQMIAYSRLHRAGRLPVRIVGMPPWSAVHDLHRLGIRTGFGDEWLRFGAVKLFS